METPKYIQDVKNKKKVVLPTPATEAPTTEAAPDKIQQEYGKYEQEQLNELNAPKYDPASGIPYFQQIYESTKKKPDPISENGLKAARIASSLGDTFGSIAEMVGAHNGARVRTNNEPSNTDKNYAKERDIRNIYKAEQDAYDNGLVNAKIQDYATGYGDYKQRQAEARHYVQQTIAQRRAAESEYRKLLMQYGQKEADRLWEEKKFNATLGETKRSNKAKEAIDREKDVNKANKTNADMEIVTRVRSLPVEWQKKMGFLKPVMTDDGIFKKTEWTFDNSIRPEVLEAAVKEYEGQQGAPTEHPTINTNILRQGGQSRAK